MLSKVQEAEGPEAHQNGVGDKDAGQNTWDRCTQKKSGAPEGVPGDHNTLLSFFEKSLKFYRKALTGSRAWNGQHHGVPPASSKAGPPVDVPAC